MSGMTKQMWVRYPIDLFIELEKQADSLGLTFAEYIRTCTFTMYELIKSEGEVFLQSSNFIKTKKIVLRGKNG